MNKEGAHPAPLATGAALESSRGFSREAVAALAVAAVGYAAAFLSGIVSARALGAGGKGTLSLFLTTVAGLSALAGLGIGQGQMYHAAKQPEKLRFFLRHGLFLSLGLGGGSAAVYWLAAGRASGIAFGTVGVAAGIVAVPVLLQLTFQRQYLLTVGRYTLAKGIGAVAGAAPLLAIALLYLLGRVSVAGVIVATVAIVTAMSVALQLAVRADQHGPPGFSKPHLKESFSFGVRLWAGEMAHFLTGRLDFFLVAWALGSIGLGVYSVAVGLAEIVSRLAYELGTIIFPAVAADSLRPGQAAAVLRTTLAAAAAMAVALAAIAEPLVVGLYGSSFAGAVPVLRVLLVATVAWSAVQILWLYGCAAGRLGYVLGVLGLAAALDAGLNLLLLPRYGLMGAGIAALLSYGTAAFALVALFCGREQCTVGEALLVRRSDLRSLGDRIAELPGRARARLGL